jgi:hypothetical protein
LATLSVGVEAPDEALEVVWFCAEPGSVDVDEDNETKDGDFSGVSANWTRCAEGAKLSAVFTVMSGGLDL